MKLHEKILSDYLRCTYGVRDPVILKALKKILSDREQGNLMLHVTVVTGKKLVVICEHPERIQEVILIGKENPCRVERLVLKNKDDPSQA